MNKTLHKKYVILNTVACYASMKCQLRYAVHATKERYIELSDLINEYAPDLTETKLETLLKMNIVTTEGAQKIRDFTRFLEVQEKLVDWATDAFVANPDNAKLLQEYIVFHDPAWNRIREAAKTLLRELNFDLKKWEQENVDPLPTDSPYLKLLDKGTIEFDGKNEQ